MKSYWMTGQWIAHLFFVCFVFLMPLGNFIGKKKYTIIYDISVSSILSLRAAWKPPQLPTLFGFLSLFSRNTVSSKWKDSQTAAQKIEPIDWSPDLECLEDNCTNSKLISCFFLLSVIYCSTLRFTPVLRLAAKVRWCCRFSSERHSTPVGDAENKMCFVFKERRLGEMYLLLKEKSPN